MMTPMHPLLELVQQDRRYRLEAYLFVDESLAFAQQLLETGQSMPGDAVAPDPADLSAIENEGIENEDIAGDGPDDEVLKSASLEADDADASESAAADSDTRESEDERHLTGQELCEAIRRYSLDQYGLLAKCVFNSWGVQSTSDFGEIVFNMIEIGRMKKTESDRREDFADVFDFDKDLVERFKIELPPQSV
jgi:uncharacterized repeat protein (TIGR04138 family)